MSSKRVGLYSSALFSYHFGDAMKRHKKLIIDQQVLKEYDEYYFSLHPRARLSPIPHPYHESINAWMIMRRPQMNALKQRWKDFIIWFVKRQDLSGCPIERCEIKFTAYYPTHARHDTDNSVPKFILDGLVEGGVLVDDDIKHVNKLVLECSVDKERPRTEIDITIKEAHDDLQYK